MGVLPAYADAELATMDLLEQLHPAVGWTGEDLPERVPCFRVRRVGGDDDGITDRARISVTAFAPTNAQARTMGEQARQLLLSGPHTTASGVIDKATTEVGPQPAITRDPDRVRARDAIYRVRLRRRT